MYLIPLNQIESVELVVHALKAAGGQADCGSCPAQRVCMKQCLTIAGAVERMLADGSMLSFESPEQAPELVASEPLPPKDATPPVGGSHLKIIK